MFRKLTRYQYAADVGYAAIVGLLGAPAAKSDGWAGIGVLLGYVVVLVFRRSSPLLALGLGWLVAILQMALLLGARPVDVAILAVLYSTAAYGDRVLRWVGLASAVAGGVCAAIYFTFRVGEVSAQLDQATRSGSAATYQFFFILVACWGVLGFSWALGRLAYARRSAVAAKHARELEQARARQDVVVEQERNRIARDMHDTVAHSLAVVIAQADGARYARLVDPAAAEQALTTIAATARTALGDVRGLLGQLRHGRGDAPASEGADLERLLQQMREAGLDIDLRQSATPLQLGTGQQLAVYRIVQEALTNALRHGDATVPVTLAIDADADSVRVTVRNRLRDGLRVERAGHGLVGMRERATLSGGSFAAGRDGDDWSVATWLPVAQGSGGIP